MSRISWWRIDFGKDEVDRLGQSVADEHISMGPVTAEFESKLAASLGVPYVATTTSGSTALLVALMSLGIGRGDEVIIPDRTWIATAHAAAILGAKVTLVDVRPDIPVFDIDLLAEKITNKTKAIMPVHLNGRDSGMVAIKQLAQTYGAYVIEDAAQAIFSKNNEGFMGTHSDAGCFSLAVTKLISTSQGGFVVTSNSQTYEQLKLVRNHGVVDNFTDTWNQIGFNFKFTDLLASFGLVQLTRAERNVTNVTKIYNYYSNAIDDLDLGFIKLIPVNIEEGEVPVWVEVLCSQRDDLIKFLDSRGIQARPFAPSLHTSGYLDNNGNFPNSDLFSRDGMFLPCGPDQPIENIDRVIDSLAMFDKIK